MGVGNVLRFDLIDRPSEEAILKALESLFSLEIIDDMCNLTEIGK